MQGRVLIREVQLLDKAQAGLQVGATVLCELPQQFEGCQASGR